MLQCFRMRLRRLTYSIEHLPRKNLITADALSRAPVQQPNGAEEHFTQGVEAHVSCVVANLPATDRRLTEIRAKQQDDELCQKVVAFCTGGWPDKQRLSTVTKQPWIV